jgi:hypothetical protein
MGTSMTQEFADKAAAFNDRLETMQEKLGDVGLRLTEALLPALEKLVGIMEAVGNVFSTLPQPLQDVALVFTAIAIPVAPLRLLLGRSTGHLRTALFCISGALAQSLPASPH